MRTRRKLEQVTSMAALLAVPLRLEIIERLRGGPMIVGDLVHALGENQATLSKQFGVLREERNGQHHITIPAHKQVTIGKINALLWDLVQHFRMDRKELMALLFG